MGWCNAWKSNSEYVTELSHLEKQVRLAALTTSVTETGDQVRSVWRNGKLAELFDLDALRDDLFNDMLGDKYDVDGFYHDLITEVTEQMRGEYLEQYVEWGNEKESLVT